MRLHQYLESNMNLRKVFWMANRFTSVLKFKLRALDGFCHIGNGEIFCGLLFFFFCVRVFLFCQLISRTVFVFFDLGGVHVWTIKNCKADCISSRLAGYWEKVSISNNRASDKPHWHYRSLRLITPTSTLIILDITKTSSIK